MAASIALLGNMDRTPVIPYFATSRASRKYGLGAG